MKPSFLLGVSLIAFSIMIAGCATAGSPPEQPLANGESIPSPTGSAFEVPTAMPPTPTSLPRVERAEPTSAVVEESDRIPMDEQTEPDVPPGAESLVVKAREMLTELLSASASPDRIALVSVEMKQWRDSSMGCPQKGMMYLTVITPGYLIQLAAGGKIYAFHTNRGDRIVLCTIDGERVFE